MDDRLEEFSDRCLRSQAPGLGLLCLPVVDSLYLSPLAFPENPYHRLVKNYKLVRDGLSDPLADARLAARVFREQWEELGRRVEAGDMDLLRLYRFCLQDATDLGPGRRGGSGLAPVLENLGAELPDARTALALLRQFWSGKTCLSASGPLALRHLADSALRPVIAYATAWLQVAGARSVMPPWVRHRFPATTELLQALRDVPRRDPECAWCREVHDPESQLKRWFGFDGFRSSPVAADGGSLQEAVVTRGMGDQSLLAILPTGGGKSLCFQLPALVRNQRRGLLTIVVSPLQALMKDQVDNLTHKTGTGAAAALYGLLTPPERGDVLERVRLGDISILYVSPEQLRNVSLRRVLEAREIGCWVFDEAHCLSKWGHDFRPDYLYAARFIRELSKLQGTLPPPIACFTATAKKEVTAEILAHFRDELNLDLALFEGGVERDNLAFVVQLVRAMEKDSRVHEVLVEHLADGGAGIVYASSRRRTEELAQYLQARGWAVEAFHAGLKAPKKKRIQEAFVSGELLRDEDLRIGFDASDRGADTRVRVAVAWLERAGLVERNENRTRVFQGRPAVTSLEEARRRIAALKLSTAQQERWLAVLAELMNCDPDEGFTADDLARLPAFRRIESQQAAWDSGETAGQRVLRTLHDMAGAGLLHQGPQLSAFLRHKVKNPSARILQQVCALERAMIAALREQAPDAETGAWQQLSLRRLNQHLVDEGLESNPEMLRRLLSSLARDGRGLAGERGSLELRQNGLDHYRIKLHRDWRTLTATAERRQALAHLVLQRGLAVFRQAMTVRLVPEARRKRYSKAQHQPLAQHYGERIFQIHVMAEYARLGAEKIRQALTLVTAYFTLDKRSFVKRFFPDRREVLERATTAESFRDIVESLGNPDQTEIVAAPEEGNRLVLAGPGSGKTRVVVHRCAFLLRVRRVDPRGILVLCYNRNAALELRSRLRALVGNDARGVTVQTYHGLAMRLTGASFAERMEGPAAEGPDFTDLIPRAVDMLEGRTELPGLEPDALRDRLLAGYRHLLVDEYQDIDGDQYRLISALVGRTRSDAKLTLLAVGDDDQNIYAFRGASLEYIRRFREDYGAEPHYLVENYRSSANIIRAANALIAHNRERMKTDRPIRIDRQRRDLPPGGRWEALDAQARGRVLILDAPDSARQAAELVGRMRQLRELGGGSWSDFALLARTRALLEPIRALCETLGIPVAWREDLPSLHRVREIAAFLDGLRVLGQYVYTEEALARLLPEHPGPWRRLLEQLTAAWSDEAGRAEVPASRILEFCYETLAEQRRERSLGDGVLLSTLHGAKGLEFPHVLIADGGGRDNDGSEEERRLYYVGMTRARETLTLGFLAEGYNPLPNLLAGDWLLRTGMKIDPPPAEVMELHYTLLSPADLDLGYAGRLPPQHRVHSRLAAVQTGDELGIRADGSRVFLIDSEGLPVCRFSNRACVDWLPRLDQVVQVRVLAMLRRRRAEEKTGFRDACRSETWEIPLAELVWRAKRVS